MSEQTQVLSGELSPVVGEPTDLLAHLEQRVTRLVERYGESRAAVEDLRGQIRERERRIAELNDRMHALEKSQGIALKRLDGVITQIEKLEQEGTSAA